MISKKGFDNMFSIYFRNNILEKIFPGTISNNRMGFSIHRLAELYSEEKQKDILRIFT